MSKFIITDNIGNLSKSDIRFKLGYDIEVEEIEDD